MIVTLLMQRSDSRSFILSHLVPTPHENEADYIRLFV